MVDQSFDFSMGYVTSLGTMLHTERYLGIIGLASTLYNSFLPYM